MELTTRLDILKDANQISQETYNILIKIIEDLKLKRNIELTEENGAMFITHLASALTRIEKNESLNKIEEFIFDEVKRDTNYELAVEITNDLEKLTKKLPEEERDFIEMHICTLLNK